MSNKPNYQVVDRGDLRKYRTEIPNSVDDMNLSVYAFRLYVHLKRVAGDSGKCWQSTDTLAKSCNISTGMVSKAKDELIAVNLISIEEHKLDRGGRAAHHITIIDIWAENFSKFSTSQNEQASSCSELPSSCSEQASSPCEIKKEHIKKEHTTRAKPTQDHHLFAIASALASVTGMDFVKNKGRLFKEAKTFYAEGDDTKIVADYTHGGAWYQYDWRGKRGDRPSLAQIRETWGSLRPGDRPAAARPQIEHAPAKQDETGGLYL